MEAPIPGSYWVEPGLLAGAYPSAAGAEALQAAGVDFFVDLTQAGEGVLSPYETSLDGAVHQRFPVGDFSCPTTDEMTAILDAIDAALADGRVVYVHCRGGTGRTGTVVGCYLVRRGASGEAALARIAELRGDSRQSPETDEQRRFVAGWTEA